MATLEEDLHELYHENTYKDFSFRLSIISLAACLSRAQKILIEPSPTDILILFGFAMATLGFGYAYSRQEEIVECWKRIIGKDSLHNNLKAAAKNNPHVAAADRYIGGRNSAECVAAAFAGLALDNGLQVLSRQSEYIAPAVTEGALATGLWVVAKICASKAQSLYKKATEELKGLQRTIIAAKYEQV